MLRGNTWHIAYFIMYSRGTQISLLKKLLPCGSWQGKFAKNWSSFFCARTWSSIFRKLALFTTSSHDFLPYHLCNAVCATCGPCDVIFSAMLLAGSHLLFLCPCSRIWTVPSICSSTRAVVSCTCTRADWKSCNFFFQITPTISRDAC